MSQKTPERKRKSSDVLSLELSTFVHATEDEERVLQAVSNVLPERMRGSLEVYLSKNVVLGYHGNAITVMKFFVDEEVEAQEAFEYIVRRMEESDFNYFLDSLEDRFEHGRIYLRVDKQEAYLGNIRISEGDDVIRVTALLKPHLRKSEAVSRYILSLRSKKTTQ